MYVKGLDIATIVYSYMYICRASCVAIAVASHIGIAIILYAYGYVFYLHRSYEILRFIIPLVKSNKSINQPGHTC